MDLKTAAVHFAYVPLRLRTISPMYHFAYKAKKYHFAYKAKKYHFAYVPFRLHNLPNCLRRWAQNCTSTNVETANWYFLAV
uniref:Uncharacterized protein n=1 Tax=Globodera rostochiensis TaxID=31243 RepID=A0A914HCK9_GLORO